MASLIHYLQALRSSKPAFATFSLHRHNDFSVPNFVTLRCDLKNKDKVGPNQDCDRHRHEPHTPAVPTVSLRRGQAALTNAGPRLGRVSCPTEPQAQDHCSEAQSTMQGVHATRFEFEMLRTLHDRPWSWLLCKPVQRTHMRSLIQLIFPFISRSIFFKKTL